ncbi:MAG: hypothetical protein DIAAKJNI_00070 [Candidatus Argoarchaeum ethanivorans]|uniref:Uncharacterized protein n=1 Tax=Candidatus Argoarchaeum ethanivorans TaxID=2608793 RepID=A0A811T5W2_9EURY|nr:MAG: hypothetical protein DIAAKJNI_00070 [Candidatus Argoarchaeum ethanivorans]
MKFPYLKFRGKLAPIVLIELKGREWVSYDATVLKLRVLCALRGDKSLDF